MPPYARLLGKPFLAFSAELGSDAPAPPPPRPPGEPRYLELPEQGVCIVLDETDTATCVQFFPDARIPRYARYQGPLPGDIEFTFSRDQARAALGEPTRENAGGGKGLLGRPVSPWDLFRWNRLNVHLEYDATAAAIRLVSVSVPQD
jgi:hypothetical protein